MKTVNVLGICNHFKVDEVVLTESKNEVACKQLLWIPLSNLLVVSYSVHPSSGESVFSAEDENNAIEFYEQLFTTHNPFS